MYLSYVFNLSSWRGGGSRPLCHLASFSGAALCTMLTGLPDTGPAETPRFSPSRGTASQGLMGGLGWPPQLYLVEDVCLILVVQFDVMLDLELRDESLSGQSDRKVIRLFAALVVGDEDEPLGG